MSFDFVNRPRVLEKIKFFEMISKPFPSRFDFPVFRDKR